MPRRSSSKKSPVAQAIVDLRAKLRETQPEFAMRLGLAAQTVARWETKLPPTGVMLKMLWQLADESGMQELGNVFRAAYLKELEERDGLKGAFALQGPLREQPVQLVRELRPIIQQIETSAITPEQAEQAIQKVVKKVSPTLWADIELFRQVLDAEEEIIKTRHPDESTEARLKRVVESYKVLSDSLNWFYVSVP